MNAHVSALYRYPVKGFSPEPLAAVDLVAGETVPYDRAFAIENGPSGFDPAAPVHMPKIRFLCLMKNAGLAGLSTRFEPETGRFSIAEAGVERVSGDLGTAEGRAAIEAFLAARFADELRGPPKILRAPGHSFSDVARKVLHLINRSTLEAMAESIGRPIDPIRFRPNLVVDGLPPDVELAWEPGRRIRIGGIDFEMVKRTERCAATTVDPVSATRDLQIPRLLFERFGHTDCGVYLKSLADGRLAVGDPVAAS